LHLGAEPPAAHRTQKGTGSNGEKQGVIVLGFQGRIVFLL